MPVQSTRGAASAKGFGFGAASAGGYQISRSLRGNYADSTYLTRTPASAGNRKTWTWSAWLKRSEFSNQFYTLFEVYSANNDPSTFNISFMSSFYGGTQDAIGICTYSYYYLITNALYRDPSAWYHIVLAVDTTQATANNRIRLYVNGSEVTAFSTRNNPTQNDDLGINQAAAHYLSSGNGRNYYGGYLTEVNFINGQQLTPSSFGQTNATTGVWEPKAYSGTYGTTGYYLNFSDNSGTTSTTLGKDYSGNGNNWTPNNFSVTAGAGNDSMVDTPTPYGSDTGAGGTVRGNYATINPNFYASSWAASSVTNGALDFTASGNETRDATMAVSSGKWYYEQVYVGDTHPSAQPLAVGIRNIGNNNSNYATSDANYWYVYGDNGNKRHNGTDTGYLGTGMVNGDIIMCAFDLDSGKIWWGLNGTWAASGNPATGANAAFTDLAGYTVTPFAGGGGSYTVTSTFNFGQRAFAYTAPSGYKALCTQNLPTPTVAQGDDYFNTVLYTGNGSTQSVTGVGFQPDLVWNKQRSSSVGSNWLNDAVRTAGYSLSSNRTDAEVDYRSYFTSFNSDGFSLAGGTDGFNANASTYVAWNWKANGAGSTNTAGSITSTVSANTTSGFSIVTYTGTGSAATVGHGLGTAPSMIIVKNRGVTTYWAVYHASLGNTKGIELNDTAAATTQTAYWNSTSPTSTVFTVNTDNRVNASTNTYVAYCFAAIPGFSAFGSYTGNGSSDGPFVYCGFRPAFVMYKESSATNSWILLDDKRNTYNGSTSAYLYPDLSLSEQNTTAGADFLSNGFKLRTTNSELNANSQTYIYAAFAENPFKYALAR